MIKKTYLIIIVLSSLIALVTVLQLTLSGKAAVKIKWSHFKSENEIASALHMRLRQDVKDHPVVFLGIEPDDLNHLLIWKKWVELNNEEIGWRFDKIYFEPQIKNVSEYFLNGVGIDVRKEQDQVIQLIRERKEQRIVFILPHIYATHFLKDNPVHRIQNQSQTEILSLTLLPLTKESSLPCVASGVDYTGQSPLGCLIQEKILSRQSKQAPPQWGGMVEQYGPTDYIMFLQKTL